MCASVRARVRVPLSGVKPMSAILMKDDTACFMSFAKSGPVGFLFYFIEARSGLEPVRRALYT